LCPWWLKRLQILPLYVMSILNIWMFDPIIRTYNLLYTINDH
jgi:hypothetical protein